MSHVSHEHGPVQVARNLIKLDRLYRELLGPQFRYKVGMMEPEWDLFMWSVLMNRHELAVFFSMELFFSGSCSLFLLACMNKWCQDSFHCNTYTLQHISGVKIAFKVVRYV